MRKVGFALGLCLALGAVRADGQVQLLSSSIVHVTAQPVALGENVPVSVNLGWGWFGGYAAALVGLNPGASTLTVGSLNIPLPLGDPWYVDDAAAIVGPTAYLFVKIPDLPSLVGHTPYLTVVAIRGLSAGVTPLIPFGPIIEDSLQ